MILIRSAGLLTAYDGMCRMSTAQELQELVQQQQQELQQKSVGADAKGVVHDEHDTSTDGTAALQSQVRHLPTVNQRGCMQVVDKFAN